MAPPGRSFIVAAAMSVLCACSSSIPPYDPNRNLDFSLCASQPVTCGGCLADSDCHDATNKYCVLSIHRCSACAPLDAITCGVGMTCLMAASGLFECEALCGADACSRHAGLTTCCDGQCVDLQSSVDNCGDCGFSCAGVQYGMRACRGGTCVVGVCDRGYADCDAHYTNGCEQTIDTDPFNCGSCGIVCRALPNSFASCVSGACITTCEPDFGDCNISPSRPSDGCEAWLKGDPKNCGACGAACMGGAGKCIDGACR